MPEPIFLSPPLPARAPHPGGTEVLFENAGLIGDSDGGFVAVFSQGDASSMPEFAAEQGLDDGSAFGIGPPFVTDPNLSSPSISTQRPFMGQLPLQKEPSGAPTPVEENPQVTRPDTQASTGHDDVRLFQAVASHDRVALRLEDALQEDQIAARADEVVFVTPIENGVRPRPDLATHPAPQVGPNHTSQSPPVAAAPPIIAATSADGTSPSATAKTARPSPTELTKVHHTEFGYDIATEDPGGDIFRGSGLRVADIIKAAGAGPMTEHESVATSDQAKQPSPRSRAAAATSGMNFSPSIGHDPVRVLTPLAATQTHDLFGQMRVDEALLPGPEFAGFAVKAGSPAIGPMTRPDSVQVAEIGAPTPRAMASQSSPEDHAADATKELPAASHSSQGGDQSRPETDPPSVRSIIQDSSKPGLDHLAISAQEAPAQERGEAVRSIVPAIVARDRTPIAETGFAARPDQPSQPRLETIQAASPPREVLPAVEAAPDDIPELSSSEPRQAQSNAPSGQSMAHPVRPDLVRGAVAQIAEIIQSTRDNAIEVKLNPEELGRVSLSMSTDAGGLTVSLAAERAETLELLRRHIDLLGQDLRRLGYSSVEFSFGEGQERAAHSGGRDPAQAGGRAQEPETIAPAPSDITPARPRAAPGAHGIDIRL